MAVAREVELSRVRAREVVRGVEEADPLARAEGLEAPGEHAQVARRWVDVVGSDGGLPPAGAVAASEAVDAPDAHDGMFGDPALATNGVRGGGLGAGSLDVYTITYGSHLTLGWSGARVLNGPGDDVAGCVFLEHQTARFDADEPLVKAGASQTVQANIYLRKVPRRPSRLRFTHEVSEIEAAALSN